MNKNTAITSFEFDHVIDSTLPNMLDQISNSSVMYAAPTPSGVGPRSGGINTQEGKRSERPEIDARQRSQGGDELSPSVVKRQVSPAAVAHDMTVIDKKFVTEISISDFDSATELSDGEAFSIVKQARSLLKLDASERKERKDTAPTPATISQYTRKCCLIDEAIDAIQDESASPLTLVLSRYTHKKRSFAVMRAALKWRATTKVRQLLSAQDAMQITSARSAAWRRCVDRLDSAIRELIEIESLTHAECLVFSDREVQHSDSKKNLLRQLNHDWREKFTAINNSSPKYRAPGLLLRHCGCRPAELEKGIDVELVDDQILVRVTGVKVRATAGQAWRKFALKAELMPSWFIDEILQSGGKKTYFANRDSMRAHLARVSEVLYPHRFREGKKDIIISAYVFRHALVTDMRAAKWDTGDIAAILGESTCDTLKWYGIRQRTGSRRAIPVAIVANSIQSARPVRTVDHANLQKLTRRESSPIVKTLNCG